MTGNDDLARLESLGTQEVTKEIFRCEVFVLPQFVAVYMMGIKIEQGKT